MIPVVQSWGIERLDLAAYLRRIGYTNLSGHGRPEGAAELLRQVHRAHSMSIPFENLGILLGRGVHLDVESLQDKLVKHGRGGYCHEQNLLLAAALERLGFAVTRLTARIQVSSRQPRTHIALQVMAEGRAYLADVGLGADGLIDPLPLLEGEYPDPDGWLHGVIRYSDGWGLSVRRSGDEPHVLYRVTEEPAMPIDFEVATHWTSTHPSSPFVTNLVVHQRKPNRRLALSRSVLTEKSAGHDVVTEIDREQLPRLLTERFGLPLTGSELAALTR